MTTAAGRLGKQNALIISPGDDQSNERPGVALAAMASIAIPQSHKKIS